jgi:hypothetical protein
MAYFFFCFGFLAGAAFGVLTLIGTPPIFSPYV